MNETRYFQWIAGDEKGQIKIFDKIESDEGELFIVFKDSSRIKEAFVAPLNQKDLTGKYMAEVDSPNNIWKFKEEWVGRVEERWELNAEQERVCVEPFVPGKKVIKLIPPRPTAPRSSSFGMISNNASPTPPPPPPSPPPLLEETKKSIDESDPVYIMMSKSKKIDNNIEMTITIAMPPKSLYDVAQESFDDGGKKVVEYIVENIDTKDIKEALKVAITQMYEYKEQVFKSPGVSIRE